MMVSCNCRVCGHENTVSWNQVGKEIPCAGCGKTLTVPAPVEPLADNASKPQASAVRFACPSCGRKYATKPELAGKKIRCNNCGAGVRVPASDTALEVGASKPVLQTFDGPVSVDKASVRRSREPDQASDSMLEPADPSADSSLLEDLAVMEGGKRRKRTEAILPSRSEAMEQVRQKVAEQEAIEAKKTAEKAKKKKKRKKSGYFDPKDTLILVGSVGGVVAVLTLIAWGYPHFRFPLGGILCILGFIVYLLGAAALRQVVAEEGAFHVILFRIFPPYQWWFVATHWADTKDYVAFFGAGLIILSIGGVVIKSSPAGKEAAESEKAYQKLHNRNPAEEPPPAFNMNPPE